jgi:hypothetical protein
MRVWLSGTPAGSPFCFLLLAGIFRDRKMGCKAKHCVNQLTLDWPSFMAVAPPTPAAACLGSYERDSCRGAEIPMSLRYLSDCDGVSAYPSGERANPKEARGRRAARQWLVLDKWLAMSANANQRFRRGIPVAASNVFANLKRMGDDRPAVRPDLGSLDQGRHLADRSGSRAGAAIGRTRPRTDAGDDAGAIRRPIGGAVARPATACRGLDWNALS